jgi:hypothetical protein
LIRNQESKYKKANCHIPLTQAGNTCWNPDKYTGTKPIAIKRKAGRRPALPIARIYNQATKECQTTRGGPDKHTDTKPMVIKREAGRRPALPVARAYNQTTREC